MAAPSSPPSARWRERRAVHVLRPVLVYGSGVKGNLRALVRLAALPVPLPFGALTGRRSLVSLANLAGAISFVLRHDGCAGRNLRGGGSGAADLRRDRRGAAARPRQTPGLFAVPPALLRLALAVIGRGANFEQINGDLIADPGKLMAAGWRPEPDTAGALSGMR